MEIEEQMLNIRPSYKVDARSKSGMASSKTEVL